jgi:ribosomal protein L11 methyltransferase
MRHLKVTIKSEIQETRDILIAVLAEKGFEGFEEETGDLMAYIPESDYDPAALQEVASAFGVEYATEFIDPQNWNEIWESGFDPVVVDGFCTVRADFHSSDVSTPYDIVVTPKMSFGTGHHATTQLMISGMEHMGFEGKTVLDFGTGTGVLAILAAKMGAETVTAIDNDDWAIYNAAENLSRNSCGNVNVARATLTGVSEAVFDVILANINRNVLLRYMVELFEKLSQDGTLLMSGLLIEDEDIVSEAAIEAGFVVKSVNTRGGWISIACKKH